MKNESDRTSATTETQDVLVRPFQERDLPRCQEILHSSYDFSHGMDLDASQIMVAEIDGHVIAVGYIHVWEWNKVAWLNDFVVDAEYRNRGIGRKLVLALADVARKQGSIILMDHPPATHPVVGFYLKLGFRLCGYNDSYFSDPKNRMAVFMGLDL